MTGPAYGKLLLEGAKVRLVQRSAVKELKGAEVYIHLKGYALARVTHLDVEHEGLDDLIEGKGRFLTIVGTGLGIKVVVERGLSVEVLHELLTNVLRTGEVTRTWVGSKEGGIYIGFRKRQVELLERLAKEVFGMEPIRG